MTSNFGEGVFEKGDRDGIPRKRRSVPATQTAGEVGTPVIGGYVETKEKDRDLQGRRKYVTYSNILANVSIVASGVRYFLNLISKPNWKFEPIEGNANSERIATQLEAITKDMRTPWHRVVRRAAMYRFYGFSIQEWTAKIREDGDVGLADIAARPQKTIEQWDCLPDGTLLGAVQVSQIDGRDIYLPRSKMIYMVDDTLDDGPEGMGLFRHIADAAKRLRRLEQLEGYGYETDLRGMPLARAPLAQLEKMVRNKDITEEQKNAILQPLKNFMESHIRNPKLSLLLDSMTYETTDEAQRPSSAKQWDFELAKADAGSMAELLRSIDRINREIARVLGVEQLLLGDNGVGSFAMAKEKSHNFALIIDSTLQELVEQFMQDFVMLLIRLNGWNPADAPTVKTDKLQYRAIEEVTGALEQMARAGAILSPDDPAINEVRDLMGLSRPINVISTLDAALLGAEDDEEDETEDPESNDDSTNTED